MTRQDGRAYDELRPIKITTDFVKFPEGSCLIECGDTTVSYTHLLESTISHLTENIERAKSELEESESRTGGYEVQAAEQDAQATELEQQAAALNAELDKLLA